MLRLFKNCFALALLSAAPLSLAATDLTLPGCEAPDSVQTQLNEIIYEGRFRGEKLGRPILEKADALNQLISEHPRELSPVRELAFLIRYRAPDHLPALQDRLTEKASQSPGDPLALALAGYALSDTNVVEAQRLLRTANSIAPNFPWPYLFLARIYSDGKSADDKLMRENTRAFFQQCPSSTDFAAQRLLARTKDPDLVNSVVSALRRHVTSTSSPIHLMEYETLWGLEFQIHKPAEYDAVRQQVGIDLERIETLNPKPDAQFQTFLIQGYKNAGASERVIQGKEDSLLKTYPQSKQAYQILENRWFATHEEPKDQSDVAAWKAWEPDYQQALKQWAATFPDIDSVRSSIIMDKSLNDEGLSEQETVSIANAMLEDCEDRPARAWCYTGPAGFLLKHGYAQSPALEMLRQAQLALDEEGVQNARFTNLNAEDDEEIKTNQAFVRLLIQGEVLEAARQLHNPALAQPLRESVEAQPPADKKIVSTYWSGRARLAVLDGRNADALTYYQLAHRTRTIPPRWIRGRLQDELGDETKRFWKELGGTEAALEMWMQSATRGPELAAGLWEKSAKPFPDFQLSDVSGNNWSLKDLHGKTLFVTMWATWCGPCQAELPHLQKLYDTIKARKDTQILALDLDEDPGALNVFLKSNNYTFPVLVAYASMSDFLQEGIPQNWIVAPNGIAAWRGGGFSGDADWEESTIKKLESVKNNE